MSLGLNASLYMGARSLSNQQIAIEVAGHNISNINTPGSSRQRAIMNTDIVLEMESGQQGTGAMVQGLESLRSRLLDSQIVTQSSLNGFYELKNTLMGYVQDSLGESLSTAEASATEGVTATTGIQNSLTEFFDAWEALSADPNSTIARNNILSKTESLISDIKGTYGRLLDLREGFFTEAEQMTGDINSLAEEIAALNEEISKIEISSGDQANDLRDRRQYLIEELAKKVNITVTEHTAGDDSMVDIALTDAAGCILVDGSYGAGASGGGDTSYRLDVASLTPVTGNVDVGNAYNEATNSVMRIVYTASTTAPTFTAGNPIPAGSTIATPTEGELGALVDVSNNVIGYGHQPPDSGETLGTPSDSLVYRLNQFTVSLISEVNTVHTTNAWDQNGTAGVAFFTAGGNAYDIALGAGITGPELIAAAQGATFPGELNGDNALSMADLRDDADLAVYHRQTIADLGTDILQAQRNQKVQELIQNQLVTQRDGISGISLDEEMTNLMVYQRAYEASARFISVINEMMQVLLAL
ncbi:MAG: flagellar hook-associated protein FlgK [Verrucomicrobiota bacterium]